MCPGIWNVLYSIHYGFCQYCSAVDHLGLYDLCTVSMCVHAPVHLWNQLSSFQEMCYKYCAIGSHHKFILFNFLQPIITL
jgi:hypothetical protein